MYIVVVPEHPLQCHLTDPSMVSSLQIFGTTYMVVAPEHPLLGALTTDGQRAEVEAYAAAASAKSDLERTDLAKGKTGVDTGEVSGQACRVHGWQPASCQAKEVLGWDWLKETWSAALVLVLPWRISPDNAKYGVLLLMKQELLLMIQSC